MKRLLFAVLALGAASALATSMVVTVMPERDTLTCTLRSLTIAATGAIAAEVEGCAAPSTTPPPSPPSPPVTGDPGYMRGTWVPRPGLIVVDQSSTDGNGGASILPGCANQGSMLGACSPYDRGIFLKQGDTLVVRFKNFHEPAKGAYFKLASFNGAGVGTAVTVSLSATPGDMSTCTMRSKAGLSPLLFPAVEGCRFPVGQLYYYNIRIDGPCTTPFLCSFKLLEPASTSP